MTQPIRYAGVARPVQAPEAYGWAWLLAPVILALELGLLVVLTGHP
jgi:hypothetical protein